MKVAVVLSGCGFQDGSEIHESVLCLLALAQGGHEYHSFAPDKPQARVVDHATGQEVSEESRNVLKEAARIARGKISPLSELKAENFDAILLPGGFGAATNLSTFAADGENCSVEEDLKKSVLAFHKAGKPIGATCIAPAALAKIFEGEAEVTMTLGTNAGSNEKLKKMQMNPESIAVDGCSCDEKNKVFTTPCYMEPDDLAGMFKGVTTVVENMARTKVAASVG